MKAAADTGADAPVEYDDEILNANWMPRPDAPLRTIRSAARDEAHPPVDAGHADAFLDAIYRNQE